jgi:hypothetical protein
MYQYVDKQVGCLEMILEALMRLRMLPRSVRATPYCCREYSYGVYIRE